MLAKQLTTKKKKKKKKKNNTFLFSHFLLNGQKFGTVTSFKYLGAVVSDDGSKPEVLSRIAQATAALTNLKPIWRDNNISFGAKVKLTRPLVISMFLYVCESLTLTAELDKKNAGY